MRVLFSSFRAERTVRTYGIDDPFDTFVIILERFVARPASVAFSPPLPAAAVGVSFSVVGGAGRENETKIIRTHL